MAEIDLANVAFFEGFDPDDLKVVRSKAGEVDADAGAILMSQGDVGQTAYVILKGQAGVMVEGVRVATLGPGSMVGEMALIDRRPRSATIKAITDLELLEFEADAFRELVATMPKAAAKVLEQMGEKLRENNMRASD